MGMVVHSVCVSVSVYVCLCIQVCTILVHTYELDKIMSQIMYVPAHLPGSLICFQYVEAKIKTSFVIVHLQIST